MHKPILIFLLLLLKTIAGFNQIKNDSLDNEGIKLSNSNIIVTEQDTYAKKHDTLNENVIIAFTDQSLVQLTLESKSVRKSGHSRISKPDILSRIRQLTSDVQLIQGSGNNRFANSKKVPLTITNTYTRTFVGISTNIPGSLINDIKKLPYVKAVQKDHPVKAHLTESVAMIKADKVWQEYGVYGEGVKIGIIDSGIDYTHPALGGGVGETFKVKGGYDFHNMDNDPMDDFNHGTLVAGVIAGESDVITGVAPKSSLYALKVLGTTGYGVQSTVLSALEWVIDPDGNGEFSDRMDIVNISIGSIGYSGDLLSTVVDELTDLGIVFCVSSGNEGENFTINSPGTAKNAITVGSVEKNAALSTFSSRGPTSDYFYSKPELVAPGSDIFSSDLQGSYSKNAGTSLSAPHVAGAVALLLNLHPDWSPAMIKAALMQGAERIAGEPLLSQGAGILNIERSLNLKMICNPPKLDYGILKAEPEIFTAKDTITLYNTSDAPVTYEIAVQGDLPAGYSYELSDNELTVNAGQERSFIFSSIFDVSQIPVVDSTLPLYEGKLLIANETDSARVPFTFYRGNILEFNSTDIIDPLIIHDRAGETVYYGTNTGKFNIALSKGNYDVIACYDDITKIVVKENVMLDGTFALDIGPELAKNKIQFKGRSPDGDAIPIANFGYEGLFHKSSLIGLYRRFSSGLWEGFIPDSVITKYYSDFSDEYRLAVDYYSIPEWNNFEKFFRFPVALNEGLDKSKIIENSPDDFYKVILKYPKEVASDTNLFYVNGYAYLLPKDFRNGIGVPRFDLSKVNVDEGHVEYVLPTPGTNEYPNDIRFFSPFMFQNQRVYEGGNNPNPHIYSFEGLRYEIPDFWVIENSEVIRIGHWYNIENKEFTIEAGLAPPVYNPPMNQLLNNHLLIDELSFYFSNKFGDFIVTDLPYELSWDNNKQTGIIRNNEDYTSASRRSISLEPNKDYSLTITYDKFKLLGKSGIAETKYNFNSSQNLESFPGIKLLNIYGKEGDTFSEESDRFKTVFNPSDSIFIFFSYTEENFIGRNEKLPKVYVQKSDSSDWVQVQASLTDLGKVIATISSGDLESGFYSVKIEGPDKKIIHTIKPAIVVMGDELFSENDRFKLFPNPNNGNFRIDLSGLDAIGKKYEILNGMGIKVLEGKVTNDDNSISLRTLNPGIYYFTILMGDYKISERILIN